MDADLLNVARTLAERGWLPGINPCGAGGVIRADVGFAYTSRDAVLEADLHFAAHNEILRRGWGYLVRDHQVSIYPKSFTRYAVEPGTTTLSLLRCLLRACEAAEKEKHDA